MFDTRSDQERATTREPIRPRYILTCPGHVWGGWMIIPFGRAGEFRRFCRCVAEQRGKGTAYGNNIRVLDTAEM